VQLQLEVAVVLLGLEATAVVLAAVEVVYATEPLL
jgi:hypothetical protein